jgi:hypothetical protein
MTSWSNGDVAETQIIIEDVFNATPTQKQAMWTLFKENLSGVGTLLKKSDEYNRIIYTHSGKASMHSGGEIIALAPGVSCNIKCDRITVNTENASEEPLIFLHLVYNTDVSRATRIEHALLPITEVKWGTTKVYHANANSQLNIIGEYFSVGEWVIVKGPAIIETQKSTTLDGFEIVSTKKTLRTCSSPNCDKVESRLDQYQRCSRCKVVYYCSKECQKNDLKNHKEIKCNAVMKVIEKLLTIQDVEKCSRKM